MMAQQIQEIDSKYIKAVDLLCGAGGATQGCEKSKHVRVIQGLNHNPHSIAINKLNHGNVDFQIKDFYKDNRNVIKKAKILIAGIECTSFSSAKGSGSKNSESRAMADELYTYQELVGADILIIENVIQFKDWGPLLKKKDKDGNYLYITKGDDKGKHIMVADPKKLGLHFKMWKLRMKHRYGFKNYSEKQLIASDYGAATIRNRLFMIFTKPQYEITWPKPTHAKFPGLTGLKPWVPCKKFLDLNNKGKSIFGRTRVNGTPSPLVFNTHKRIAYGIKKFGIKDQAFISKYYGTGHNNSSINEPLHTITTKDRHLIVSTDCFYVQHYHGASVGGSIDNPLNTIVTKDEKQLITVKKIQFIDKYYSGERNVSSIDDPLHTILTNTKANLCTVTLSDKLDIPNKDEVLDFCKKHFDSDTLEIAPGIFLLDVHMRWVSPRELASCQGFDEDYQLIGTKSQIIRGIGNSISPHPMTAIMDNFTETNKIQLNIA